MPKVKVLTALKVQNAKAKSVVTEISDGGCAGLRLVVHPTGHRVWIVRYRYGGRTRKLTLGNAIVLRRGEKDPGNGALTLMAARKACTDALHRLAQGHDPGTEKLARQYEKEREQARADETFEAVALDYFERAAVEKKDFRSAPRQLANLQRLAFPVIGKLPISSIRRSDIVRLLDKISVEQGPTAADGVLGILSGVMKEHAKRSDDFVPPIVPGMRKTSTKERARERILDDAELTAVWRASSEGGVFGSFVRFLLLTACRRNEASEMVWSELGRNGNGNGALLWTLPKERNKSKQELVRPLSSAAQAVLAGVPRPIVSAHAGTMPSPTFSAHAENLVFQADGRTVRANVGGMKSAFDQACGVKGWVLHDLRRTARSLMSRAGVSENHAERCLGHVIGGVKGVYDRHRYVEEMRLAYEKLATLIANITNPEQASKVVRL
jgi:integrase